VHLRVFAFGLRPARVLGLEIIVGLLGLVGLAYTRD